MAASFGILVTGGGALASVSVVLFALENGIMWPSFLSLPSALAPSELQAEIQGFGASAGSSASIPELVGGGVLYESLTGWSLGFAAGVPGDHNGNKLNRSSRADRVAAR